MPPIRAHQLASIALVCAALPVSFGFQTQESNTREAQHASDKPSPPVDVDALRLILSNADNAESMGRSCAKAAARLLYHQAEAELPSHWFRPMLDTAEISHSLGDDAASEALLRRAWELNKEGKLEEFYLIIGLHGATARAHAAVTILDSFRKVGLHDLAKEKLQELEGMQKRAELCKIPGFAGCLVGVLGYDAARGDIDAAAREALPIKDESGYAQAQDRVGILLDAALAELERSDFPTARVLIDRAEKVLDSKGSSSDFQAELESNCDYVACAWAKARGTERAYKVADRITDVGSRAITLIKIGEIQAGSGDKSGAEDSANRAAEALTGASRADAPPLAWLLLGRLCARLQEYDASNECFQNARGADGTIPYTDTIACAATYAARNHDLDAARKFFQMALEESGDSPSEEVAEAAVLVGVWEHALEWLKDTELKNRKFVEILNGMARGYAELAK